MWANEWLADQHIEDQRRFQQLLIGSFVAHVVLFTVFAFAPTPDPPPLPKILRVNLVAGLPGPSAPARKPPPAPVAVPAPTPAPAPVAKPKQVVLPKKAPKAVPKKRAAPAARPEPVEYEDAMAQLRKELGESTPAPSRPAEDVADADLMATTKPAQSSTGSATLDKETAKWVIATKRHIRGHWITPPEFLNRDLTTIVEVELTLAGDVLDALVVGSSGDPFFDDNAVRAVMQSKPLPAPPSAGKWTFSFSED